MLKKMLTAAAMVASVAGAFVGSSSAKSLLQDNRWVIVDDPEGQLHSTLSASAACPGAFEETCAYVPDANGDPIPSLTKFRN